MNNKFIYLLFITFNFSLYIIGQNKIEKVENGFIISVLNDKYNFNIKEYGQYKIIDYYDYTNPTNEENIKLPSKVMLIAIPPYSKPKISVLSYDEVKNEKSIPLLNPILEKFNDSTLIEKENYIENNFKNISDNKIYDIIGYGWYRGNYCIIIKINTHYFNANDASIIERKNVKLKIHFDENYENNATLNPKIDLHDFSIIENLGFSHFENSKNNFLNDSTGNWIDYNMQYVKIATYEDGIFKIGKKDLDSLGVNTSLIIPKTFQLFESGKEVPVLFYGKDENYFSDSDYLIFYGKKNYSRKDYRITNSKNEEYNEFMNRFTDTTYFFLTWGKNNGLRIPKSNSVLISNDTINYYKSFNHIEDNQVLFFANNDELQNQMPNYLGNKTWYFHQSQWLYSGTVRNYNFNAIDLIPNKEAYFYFKGSSGGSNQIINAHNLTLRVNNYLLDSISINRYDQVLLKGKLNVNLLKSTNNILSVKNYNNGTSINTIAVDWYEYEYPRKLKMENDKLLFQIYSDVKSSVKTIKIENTKNQEYVIIKYHDNFKLISNYSINNNNLIFSDTVKANDKYIVISINNLFKPKFISYKNFANLRDKTEQVDYIAITHNNFVNSAKEYVNQISNLYNIKTELFNVEDIFDEFSFGYPDPSSIRLFLFTTFQKRKIPKPSYTILIGDANYDYKDYFYKATGVKGGRNYIPSYGYPVSDNWYVVWDNIITIPQLKIGRLPINNIFELNNYLSKVKNILFSKYDEFNKSYLFFSGGPSNDINQINNLKSINDFIIKNYIEPPPIAGIYSHFYKTTNPQTDFGPYSTDEISTKIRKGGLFISYIGHSGTSTWDNSINEVDQLTNNYNKNPLITDFGCSTNKFAEPDISCFGERFILNKNGQAIGYIGNSSLGFTSTAYTVPKYFYENLLVTNNFEVGNAILKAKAKMFSNAGNNYSTKIFSLTNTLIGDPIIKIPIPPKPNLVISNNDIKLNVINPTSNKDSLSLKIIIKNYGQTKDDSIDISLEHIYMNKLENTIIKKIPLPKYLDSLDYSIYIKNKPGDHKIKIMLDSKNVIDEIYEDDNQLTYQINVYSTEVRDLLITQNENSVEDSILILNPTFSNEKKLSLKYQISMNPNFLNTTEKIIMLDTLRTFIKIPDINSERYWLRYKLDLPNSNFSLTKSFKKFKKNYIIYDDSISFSNTFYDNTYLASDGIKIKDSKVNISITSAGWSAGATCVIAKNGINLLSNSYFAGIGIVVFDPITFNVDYSNWYELFNNPTNVKKLGDYINSIPYGKIVALGVSDDAANNITVELKNAIKTLGSTKIDQLKFRGSWALIGKKGANPKEVIEFVKGPYDGLIYVDTTFVIKQKQGKFETNFIGPVDSWKRIEIDKKLNYDSKININIIGKDDNGKILNLITTENNDIDISKIDANKFPYIKLQAELISDSLLNSPTIKSIRITYNCLPELAINYQTVSISKDSIELGENINGLIKIFNVGETTAKNFNVVVEIETKNYKEKIFEQLIDSLHADSKKNISFNYLLTKNYGDYYFNIYVDKENKVKEIYEDNNNFKIPFYVKKNNKPAKLFLTIDGVDIYDGDYVSSNPKIEIKLNDESLVPIKDTSKIDIFLNNKRISYLSNQISVNFSNSNPKVIVNYQPTLVDGNYILKVVGRNATNDLIDSSGIIKKFIVKNSLEVLNVFNYPNPMKDKTDFTFKLTSLPDELKIIIYTIAGRKIKEIKINSSFLKNDFNTINWDGRDEDGNKIGNGVYFYKVIIKKNNKVISKIGKLAKVE
ncbi:MAG: C25 family cysteine peptidase [Melioribacteraceae bacterium]|nr:C25 family cysteine peptidase [Melioribacteraceae bacterium]